MEVYITPIDGVLISLVTRLVRGAGWEAEYPQTVDPYQSRRYRDARFHHMCRMCCPKRMLVSRRSMVVRSGEGRHVPGLEDVRNILGDDGDGAGTKGRACSQRDSHMAPQRDGWAAGESRPAASGAEPPRRDKRSHRAC